LLVTTAIGGELERDQLTPIINDDPPRAASEGLFKSTTSILSVAKDEK